VHCLIGDRHVLGRLVDGGQGARVTVKVGSLLTFRRGGEQNNSILIYVGVYAPIMIFGGTCLSQGQDSCPLPPLPRLRVRPEVGLMSDNRMDVSVAEALKIGTAETRLSSPEPGRPATLAQAT
jgi:hypothetical protein